MWLQFVKKKQYDPQLAPPLLYRGTKVQNLQVGKLARQKESKIIYQYIYLLHSIWVYTALLKAGGQSSCYLIAPADTVATFEKTACGFRFQKITESFWNIYGVRTVIRRIGFRSFNSSWGRGISARSANVKPTTHARTRAGAIFHVSIDTFWLVGRTLTQI